MNRNKVEIITLLEQLLKHAEQDDITEIFVWFRAEDESSDYVYLADDEQDMLYELGTAILNERCEPPQDEVLH